MSDDQDPDINENKNKIKDKWGDGSSGEAGSGVLFLPDELDIYVNKVTMEAYIFHGKPIEHDSIEKLEYDHQDKTIDVYFKNGSKIDLGIKIQWIVRPYLKNSYEIHIVQSKDGEAIAGTVVPLVHINTEETKPLKSDRSL